jgi:hypothetical protein
VIPVEAKPGTAGRGKTETQGSKGGQGTARAGDELVNPVILGGGKRLFEERVDREVLKLVDSRMFATGVVYFTYRPADEGYERLRHV